MKLLDSPSVIIRGKVYLLLLATARSNQELLPACFQNRYTCIHFMYLLFSLYYEFVYVNVNCKHM